MLQWNDKFETGHSVIDSEHRLLISYVNQLESMARTTNPNRQEVEFVINLVDFVEAYTRVHFSHEESCMVRYRCPAHAENQLAHQNFLEFFQNFKLRFETEGCRPEVLKKLHEYCCSWIQNHILQVDARLKPCLSANPPEGEPD